MEIFRGRAQLPGADKPWDVQVEIEWSTKSVTVRIDEAPGSTREWAGSEVQTYGTTEEIVFRTRGIPAVLTHWWHFTRRGAGNLRGVILAAPGDEGDWETCTVILSKVKYYGAR